MAAFFRDMFKALGVLPKRSLADARREQVKKCPHQWVNAGVTDTGVPDIKCVVCGTSKRDMQ